MNLSKKISAILLVGTMMIPTAAFAGSLKTPSGGTLNTECNEDTGFVNVSYYNPTYGHRAIAKGRTKEYGSWKTAGKWSDASAVLAVYGNKGYYEDR